MKSFFKFSKFRIILCVGCCLIAAFVCIFGASVWSFYFGETNAYSYRRGSLAVHFVDVGQGDCIIVKFPDGKVAVIDGGQDMYAPRVANYLRTRVLGRNGRIDYLIASHAHWDHVGSLSYLLNKFDVGTVYRPHNLSVSPLEPKDSEDKALALGPAVMSTLYANFITTAYSTCGKSNVKFIEAGIEIANGYYEMFFHTPTLDMISRLSGQVTEDFNEISPIITIRYGTTVFVLTGDAGSSHEASISGEQWFVQMPSAAKIDFANSTVILKVGHHGSYSATRDPFLDFIRPNKAVISYGEGSSFEFPDDWVKARLIQYLRGEENLYETAIHGNVVFSVSGDKISTFIGFDNAPDLTLLWVIVFVLIIFCSFFNYSMLRVKPLENFAVTSEENNEIMTEESVESVPSEQDESKAEPAKDDDEEEAIEEASSKLIKTKEGRKNAKL